MAFKFKLMTNRAVVAADRYTLMIQSARPAAVGSPLVHDVTVEMTPLETGGDHLRVVWDYVFSDGGRISRALTLVTPPTTTPDDAGHVLGRIAIEDPSRSHLTVNLRSKPGMQYALYVMPVTRVGPSGMQRGETEKLRMRIAQLEVHLAAERQLSDSMRSGLYALWNSARRAS